VVSHGNRRYRLAVAGTGPAARPDVPQP